MLVLLFSAIFRKMTKGAASVMFLLMIGSMLGATVFSIVTAVFDNLGNVPDWLIYTANTFYFLFRNLSTPAFVLYVVSLADTWHKLIRSKWQMALVITPYSLLTVLLIINLFTEHPLVFGVENHTYQRGPLIVVLYAVAFFYLATAVLLLIVYRNILSDIKIISLMSLVVMTVLSVIIQFFMPHIVVEMFASSLAVLVMTMTTQRPEEIMDTRTGLENYNSYADNIKRSYAIGKTFSIIMINIENSASIQAMLTYDNNVKLLREIATEMKTAVKNNRAVADMYYLDRGRFRIILSYKNIKKAEDIANTLNITLRNNINVNSLSIGLEPKICVTNCPEDVKDFETLTAFGVNFHERNTDGSVMLAADLFKQKNFDMANNIDLIIDKAIKNNSFKVYYQPIYSVEREKFTTAEALLRLIDEDYGFVPPDMFIPAAEKSGAIHKIGDFVLDDVCRFIASEEFKKLGLEYIEINLSVTQCIHGDLADKVLETLEKYNLSSDKINLEITETAISLGQATMKQNLDKLSEAGVKFSLDDYGTGYSNMKRVVQLPLKIVKLDKSFVDEQNNPKMWIVLQNTVKMLKDMNMEIVVEGIEDKQMVDLFSDLKCDYIQGYYFSKPIPENQFVEFISDAHGV